LEAVMIELVFVVCLRATPLECEERSIAYLPEVSLMTCMMQAQPQLAQWSAQHPALQIARWSCVAADRREIRA
jgi:hypothetical protein